MILAKTSRRRSRLNTLMVTFVACMAFTLGGFATVGVMKVVNFLKGETAQTLASADVVTPIEVTQPADVTRTTPPTLLAVATETAEEPAALVTNEAPAIDLAEEPLIIPTSIDDILNGPELELLKSASVAGAYDLIAVDQGGATRVALHFRDIEDVAQLLRAKIDAATNVGTIQAGHAVLADALGTDTDSLVFQLLQASLTQGSADETGAARLLRQEAFAASDARTETIDGKKVYVVRPFDSLAYISLQFYGNTQSAQQILAANRDQLSTPADLRSGMFLIIPNA